MSAYKRFRVKGGTYFFTVVTFDRTPLLTLEKARQCLRSAWKKTQNAYPFTTDAICLLPDHLHCIWTLPENDSDFSGRWNMIKGLFSKCFMAQGHSDRKKNFTRKCKGEVAIWQRRFWEHCIRDEDDLEKHFDYIHYNPVKHGYVTIPSQWKWSSLHRYIAMKWYNEKWGHSEPIKIRNFECNE